MNSIEMADGGWQTRNVRACGGPLPLFNRCTSRTRNQSTGGQAQPKTWRTLLGLLAFLAIALSVSAQNYSVDWYTVAGGGGTSTGGTYQVSGTIGQPDAGNAMIGGTYSLTGGFWSLINVVQMPGVPNLIIVPNGPNSVKIIWPDPATNTYTLQQNNNLSLPAGWSLSAFSVASSNGTNSITITPPVGDLFFRLAQP